METYKSKPVTVNSSAADVYEKFRRIDNLTPIVGDKVEKWQADEDSCSFVAMGFPLSLRVTSRVLDKSVSVGAEGNTPLNFGFTVNFDEPSPGVTELVYALDIEMNMMIKMMVGSKLQDGLDKIAESSAAALNHGL